MRTKGRVPFANSGCLPAFQAPKLASIGEVDELSILSLVERLVPSAALTGEPGYVHHWRAVTDAQRRASALGPDVLYVVPE